MLSRPDSKIRFGYSMIGDKIYDFVNGIYITPLEKDGSSGTMHQYYDNPIANYGGHIAYPGNPRYFCEIKFWNFSSEYSTVATYSFTGNLMRLIFNYNIPQVNNADSFTDKYGTFSVHARLLPTPNVMETWIDSSKTNADPVINYRYPHQLNNQPQLISLFDVGPNLSPLKACISQEKGFVHVTMKRSDMRQKIVKLPASIPTSLIQRLPHQKPEDLVSLPLHQFQNFYFENT